VLRVFLETLHGCTARILALPKILSLQFAFEPVFIEIQSGARFAERLGVPRDGSDAGSAPQRAGR
jgi:hypothetical protein